MPLDAATPARERRLIRARTVEMNRAKAGASIQLDPLPVVDQLVVLIELIRETNQIALAQGIRLDQVMVRQ